MHQVCNVCIHTKKAAAMHSSMRSQCVVNIASSKVVVKSAKAVQIRVQFVAKVSERGLLTRSNVHLHPRGWRSSFYAAWSVRSDCFSSRDFEICA
jgi:hypothetical protein